MLVKEPDIDFNQRPSPQPISMNTTVLYWKYRIKSLQIISTILKGVGEVTAIWANSFSW